MPSAVVDTRIRTMLKAAKFSQSDLARALRRSQGWVNKYINGVGTATIDDVLGIAAFFGLTLAQLIRVDTLPIRLPHADLSETERRLLRLWQRLRPDQHDDAFAVLGQMAKNARPSKASEPLGPPLAARPATTRTAPGKRRGA